MSNRYPAPQDVGVFVPPYLVEERFRRGFRHALGGGQITEPGQLRLSFRAGFRAGKLYCRELRRASGVIDLPMRARVRFRLRP